MNNTVAINDYAVQFPEEKKEVVQTLINRLFKKRKPKVSHLTINVGFKNAPKPLSTSFHLYIDFHKGNRIVMKGEGNKENAIIDEIAYSFQYEDKIIGKGNELEEPLLFLIDKYKIN